MPKKQSSVTRTSFTKRTSLHISVAVVAFVLCFGVLTYIFTRINAESNFMSTVESAGALTADMLDDHLRSVAGRLGIIMENEDMKGLVYGLNAAKTSADARASEGFEAITGDLNMLCRGDVSAAWIIAEQSGIMIDHNGNVLMPDEYGLANKHWYESYIAGKANGRDYLCDHSEENGTVIVIVPVRADGNVYAFCGIETRAESVFNVLSQYSAGKGGVPAVTANGSVVYCGGDIRNKFGLSEDELLKIGSQSLYSSGVDSYIPEGGREVYYYNRADPADGRNVIVFFDNASISGGYYGIFMRQMIVLVCMCALLIITVMNILHRESEPLHEIRDCTNEMVSGNYNYRIETIGRSELGAIARNVNRIAEIMQAKTSVITNYNTTDILTGLKNRSALYERMNDIIQTREEGRSRFAVMFVDIDNFRWLNETLGHTYGDEVLSRFASIMKEQLPADMPVYRFSGDEFIILKEFDTDFSEVYDAAENLHNRFDRPIEILNDKIYIKFSVGVSIYPDDDVTPENLLRDAESALHRAKDGGKDRVAFYTKTNRTRSDFSRSAIARTLPNALKNGELYLHYQPIVSTVTRDVHGFEVLLRWISPEFGIVPPADFISIAEESGDILTIGDWIFESACRTLREINKTINPNIIMSVNVSPVQLRRADFIEHIRQVIDITQVNPKNLQLEITESILVDFNESNGKVIDELNKMGIALALDDFGTGYSSLNYLKNFPIKCLKIDKSFIDEINSDQRDYVITDSIIDLVHGLGIQTVAEGIETVGQYNFLAQMKCDFIQGFLMSKPLDERDAIEFVERYDILHKPDQRRLEENERQLADEKEQMRRLEEERNHEPEDGDVPAEKD